MGRTEKSGPPVAAESGKKEGGLPAETERAERIARQVVERLESGRLSPQELEGLGLTANRLRHYLQEIERARALMASARGRPDAPPTFADLLKSMDASSTAGRALAGGAGDGGIRRDEGRGDARDLIEGVKESVDLEYQRLLEEYYRSLADPAWKRSQK